VIVTNGPEGMDQFVAAVDDMGKNNPASLAAFRSLVSESGHRDSLSKVTATTHKLANSFPKPRFQKNFCFQSTTNPDNGACTESTKHGAGPRQVP